MQQTGGMRERITAGKILKRFLPDIKRKGLTKNIGQPFFYLVHVYVRCLRYTSVSVTSTGIR